MPDEVAQIITHCEERLMKAKMITKPFSVTEIQGSILKEHLVEEDYLVPHKVSILIPSASHYHSQTSVLKRSPILDSINEKLQIAILISISNSNPSANIAVGGQAVSITGGSQTTDPTRNRGRRG